MNLHLIKNQASALFMKILYTKKQNYLSKNETAPRLIANLLISSFDLWLVSLSKQTISSYYLLVQIQQ